MDYIWVAVAFACGFLVRQIKLPPLVGYLAAGFGLNALGVVPEASLETLADLGVTLLLFTIGLKLDLRSLLKVEIWGGATGHMSAIIALTIVNCLFFGYLGIVYFTGLDMAAAALIGFASVSAARSVRLKSSKKEAKCAPGMARSPSAS